MVSSIFCIPCLFLSLLRKRLIQADLSCVWTTTKKEEKEKSAGGLARNLYRRQQQNNDGSGREDDVAAGVIHPNSSSTATDAFRDRESTERPRASTERGTGSHGKILPCNEQQTGFDPNMRKNKYITLFCSSHNM